MEEHPQAEPEKKTIKSFLKSEKGGLSKKGLIDAAITAGLVFALSQAVSAQATHSNSLTLTGIQNPKAVGKHTHHSSY